MSLTDVRLEGRVSVVAQRKREMRGLCLERRNKRSIKERSRLDKAIVSRMTGLSALYTKPFCLYADRRGDRRPTAYTELPSKREPTALPRCGEDRSMTFHIIESPEQLSPGLSAYMSRKRAAGI